MSTFKVNAIQNLAGETPYQPTLGTLFTFSGETEKDFTGIPDWVSVVTVMMEGHDASGTSNGLVQIGDAGGIEASGYVGGAAYDDTGGGDGAITQSTGIALLSTGSPLSFSITLRRMDSGGLRWAAIGTYYTDTTNDRHGSTFSVKTLTARLDRIRITTANGSDTIDAGDVNIMYE